MTSPRRKRREIATKQLEGTIRTSLHFRINRKKRNGWTSLLYQNDFTYSSQFQKISQTDSLRQCYFTLLDSFLIENAQSNSYSKDFEFFHDTVMSHFLHEDVSYEYVDDDDILNYDAELDDKMEKEKEKSTEFEVLFQKLLDQLKYYQPKELSFSLFLSSYSSTSTSSLPYIDSSSSSHFSSSKCTIKRERGNRLLRVYIQLLCEWAITSSSILLLLLSFISPESSFSSLISLLSSTSQEKKRTELEKRTELTSKLLKRISVHLFCVLKFHLNFFSSSSSSYFYSSSQFFSSSLNNETHNNNLNSSFSKSLCSDTFQNIIRKELHFFLYDTFFSLLQKEKNACLFSHSLSSPFLSTSSFQRKNEYVSMIYQNTLFFFNELIRSGIFDYYDFLGFLLSKGLVSYLMTCKQQQNENNEFTQTNNSNLKNNIHHHINDNYPFYFRDTESLPSCYHPRHQQFIRQHDVLYEQKDTRHRTKKKSNCFCCFFCKQKHLWFFTSLFFFY